ncbi:MAG: type VI secretion protein ImpB, partial [Clostridia bacterium]|nr:type VI secretion protein ImpB [Clostridia bacterium]
MQKQSASCYASVQRCRLLHRPDAEKQNCEKGVTSLDHTYIAIDLKSFYASVECMDRHTDPLTTNLVVADPGRTEKTICLAVSPSLKAYGIPGRARLFEVVQRVREVNAERLRQAVKLGCLQQSENGRYQFRGTSSDAAALRDPSLEVGYIVAPPRMKLYEKISTQIFSIYMKYVSPDDIHVYSIDEVFMDVTSYLKAYGKSAHDLAMDMIREVLAATGITATAGIGTNLYLAKVAMDIVAKHVEPDAQGVRIAELDERAYREQLWCHTPLTDFWRVGRGTAKRLEGIRCRTMGDIARLSTRDERKLYDLLGINAELLIDHAWGWEPTDIRTIKSYKPESNSITSGQVLSEPYSKEKGRLIVREMTELLALDLVRKKLVTRQITLTIGYDQTSLTCAFRGKSAADSTFTVTQTGKPYTGIVTTDRYGRQVPKHAHGTGNLTEYTSSTKRIMETMLGLYDRLVDPDFTIRYVTIVAAGVILETEIPDSGPVQLDLFTDYEAQEQEKAAQQAADERERKLQRMTLALQDRYG